MEKIKDSSIAGSFYPADKEELINLIEGFKNANKNYYELSARAVIVPHAGLIFSGRLAYEGINQLDRNIKNLFIFAPAHAVGFEGLALTGYDKWQTPLGEIPINQVICDDIAQKYNANFNDDAHEPEHSIEIQIPIIQSVFNDVNIVPILIGRENFEVVGQIIEEYYQDPENGFIISSDLSHFLTDEEAKKLDNTTAQMIETGELSGFRYDQACGALGIAGLVDFANRKGFSLIRIDMTNSAEVTEDKSRVVGYGCWFLYEGDKNQFIKKYYSDALISLVHLVIESKIKSTNVTVNYPQVLDEFGACFVTLEKFGQLRGCIGSIIAHQPLINDLIAHSKDSAFNDYRFNPVTENELNDLKVSISILTSPKSIAFSNEQDLLDKIVPNKDGIIIKDGEYQAVYLPSVWEQLPDKTEFLNSLKVKAGLSADYFSDTFEAYRYETVYIKEE